MKQLTTRIEKLREFLSKLDSPSQETVLLEWVGWLDFVLQYEEQYPKTAEYFWDLGFPTFSSNPESRKELRRLRDDERPPNT